MAIYLGNSNGKVGAIKGIYIGDANGKAKQITEMYWGDENGKAKNIYTSEFIKYTGNWEKVYYSGIASSTTPYCVYALTSSGTLNLNIPSGYTVLAIGTGGGNGGRGVVQQTSDIYGGGAGGGGNIAYFNFTTSSNREYIITIGAGGVGGKQSGIAASAGGTTTMKLATNNSIYIGTESQSLASNSQSGSNGGSGGGGSGRIALSTSSVAPVAGKAGSGQGTDLSKYFYITGPNLTLSSGGLGGTVLYFQSATLKRACVVGGYAGSKGSDGSVATVLSGSNTTGGWWNVTEPMNGNQYGDGGGGGCYYNNYGTIRVVDGGDGYQGAIFLSYFKEA